MSDCKVPMSVYNQSKERIAEPIKGVPMVRVLDENGKEVLRGWYIFHENKSVCFAHEKKPEYYDHLIAIDGSADWGMPRRIEIKRITPPYTIEVIESE